MLERWNQKARREAAEGLPLTWDPSRAPYEPYGLKLRSNNCYFNAVVLSLLHHPRLAEYFGWHHNRSSCPKECPGCCFGQLVLEYWDKDRDRDSVRGDVDRATDQILNLGKRSGVRIDLAQKKGTAGWKPNGGQQDAREYMEHFVNWCESKIPANELQITDNLLRIEERNLTTCHPCGNVSLGPITQHPVFRFYFDQANIEERKQAREERLEKLRKDGEEGPGITDSSTQPLDYHLLTDFVNDYFKTVEQGLECHNPRCEFFEIKEIPKTMLPRLFAVPDLLCISLARFALRYDDQGNAIHDKIQDRVQFDPYLDLSKFTNHQVPMSAFYKLYAVNKHSGTTYSGHYNTWVRHRGRWFEVDDILVQPSTSEAAREQADDPDMPLLFTPTVLYYERIRGSAELAIPSIPAPPSSAGTSPHAGNQQQAGQAQKANKRPHNGKQAKGGAAKKLKPKK